MSGQYPLFVAHRSRQLEISEELDAEIAELFPYVDRREEYYQLSAWLYTRPRLKCTKRRVMFWMSRAARQFLREHEKQMSLQREIMAGQGPR